jgi:hypothetical protein
MPNQSNFRNDVVNQTDSRFLASRVVRIPTEQILLEEIPASFGYDEEDNVEFHFYTANSNLLVTSIVTKLSDQTTKLQVVAYDDGTYKTYLQIDFTKLMIDKNTTVVPGDYKVSINLFSDEIGSYDDRVLTISEISPSRTELEVFFNNSFDEVALAKNDRLRREFILDSFPRADAIGVMKKILQDGITSQNDFEGLTANNIINNIDIENVQSTESTIGRLKTLELEDRFRTAINEYLPKLFEKIREQIVIGDERVQSDELELFIRDEIKRTFQELQVSMDTRVSLT